MPKATPLILALTLMVTAMFLSLRSKPPAAALPAPAPPVAAAATPEAPPAEPSAKSEVTAATIAPRPWPQAVADIAADKGATFGNLENGLRYIIYPNSEPPQRVSLRLHIAAGSLMEADAQQGLAHFLEHMVFNGSKHYAGKELVPEMQRRGIGFGAHVNAYTSFDETVYMLDLPDLAEDTLKLGFTVMRDFGDGALLQPAEIDRERGVILSEKISRDTVNERLMEQQFNALLPDSLVTKRFPIGLEEVIKAAPRDRFADFYTRYYTPARMTFIVVGDVNPVAMSKQIEAAFRSMVNPAEPGKAPDLGSIKSPEGLATAVFSDKEVSSTHLSLTLVRPYQKKPDSVATRTSLLPLEIANAMLSRRFERLAQKENSPIAGGSASNEDIFNYAEIGSVGVVAADERWQEAVPVLEQEFRRALEHGFTAAELAEAKANILNAYEQAVKQQATRKSAGIAMALVKSINAEEVFSTPQANLEIVTKGLEAIDPASCHAALKTFWDATGMHLILTTKDKPDNAEQNLAAIYQESTGVRVAAPAAGAAQKFAYTNFGKPGSITSRKEVADLGLTQLVLSNNIRINLKPTDFEKGRILLLARIGSGQLSEPAGKPMLEDFATAVFEGGGLGKHSLDELQQILAGKNVGATLGIGEDAFTLGGNTTPADFNLQVRLMCACLTDPGYRKEGLWQFQKAIPTIYQQLNHTPAGPEQQLQGWLHGGDSRYTPAPMEQLAAYTLEDAKKWLTPELTKGYLELTIVGDFKVEAVLPELLASFGALPKRDRAKPELAAARQVVFPNAPAEKSFTYDSKIPQAVATAIWKTQGLRNNQKDFRRLNILAEIYQDRLRVEIRQKLGASYSPNGIAAGSEALDDFGYILGQSVGKSPDVPLLLRTMRELANTLATKGATADELDRALKPTLSMLKQSLRDNKYWLNTALSQCQLDPKRLDLVRGRDADYASITVKEINALAKKYLSAENAMLIGIKPKE
ncbi:MAG: insulinase family protein [Verrucomicrobia bacterium]|nr:MAG: insulinase family protein [Verrucomicrobiota bacterium]